MREPGQVLIAFTPPRSGNLSVKRAKVVIFVQQIEFSRYNLMKFMKHSQNFYKFPENSNFIQRIQLLGTILLAKITVFEIFGYNMFFT